MKIIPSLLVLLLGAPVFAVPLSVSVVDAQGTPVAGADVQLELFGTSRGVVVHQSGADGRATFEVDAPTPAATRDFAGRLAVYKSGFALGSGVLKFKTPSQVTLVTAGAPISGTVGDADKKPVAGALVSIFYWRKNGAFVSSNLSGGPLQAHGQTTTDAGGKWSLSDLPPDIMVTVSIVAPGYARGQAQVASGASVQTVLHAGAQIKGRLLGLDEKPLAGVHVYAQPTNNNPGQEGYGEGTTTKDGSFDLDSLEPGAYNVMFQSDEDAPYVVAAFEGVSAAVDAPVQLKEARAVVGVQISGKVTERGTDKGIAGVQIGVYGAANPASSAAVASATTGENGVWKKRTLPGQSKVYMMGTPQEFVREQGEKNLEIPVAGKGDLNFELSRASKITGRLVDENGQGVHTSSLVFRQKYQEYAIQSDEQGNFSAFGPGDGEVEVGRSRWNGEAGTDDKAQWDVVGTTKFAVQGGKPLEIQLKRAQVSSLELGVFDQNDAAVEGAKIVVNLKTKRDEGESWQPRELVSDKTGRIYLGGIRADQSVAIQSADKAGFDAAPLPKIEKQNGVYRADIKLTRRDGKAGGELFDAKGAPVAQAKVFGSGIETTSDDAGRFSLGPLPAGVTEIFAWKDDGFALSSSDGTRLDLKRQTLAPTDPERAGALVAALREETKGTKYWRRDSLASMLLGGDFDSNAAKVSAAGGGVYRLILRFASDASSPAAKWVALLGGIKSPSDRLYSAAIWSSRVSSLPKDEATLAFANSLQSDVAAVEHDAGNNWQNSIGIFGAAALFERLGQNAQADALFEHGQVYVLKNFPEKGGKDGQNPSQDDTLSVLGEVAAVSPRFARKLVALVDTDSAAYSRLLKDGAPVVARLNGLDAARPFLDQLKAAPQAKPDSYGNNTSITSSWQQAVTEAVSAGGASNPKLALELAQSLPISSDAGNSYGRDAALGEAALFQPSEVAAGVWRDALPRLEPGAAMRFIARIAQTDEPLARGFYEAARERFDAQRDDAQSAVVYGRARQVAAFSFYEARFAPARARARLERGFGMALKDPNSRYDIGQYVRAMAVFDTDRALAWADKIGNDENSGFAGFEGKRSVARWLSLDASARQKFDFGDRSGRGEGDF